MSDMLSTGVSGLLAFQASLNTTSHNISNSTTVGYSRQSTNLAASTPQFQGGGWVGSGVDVTGIQRTYDDIVAGQVRTANSSKNQWDSYTTLSDQVNNMFTDPKSGISAALQNFSNAFQAVASAPTSTPQRQVLISQAQTLVSNLQSYGSQLNQIGSQINSQLDSETATISGLAKSIAGLNTQIVAAVGSGQGAPNDLLDQRDTLVDQLSQHVNVSTVKQSDGSMSVFVGSGQALVLGSTSATLKTAADSYDPSREIVQMTNSSGAVDITAGLTGGSVGGLLSFRSQILDPAKNSLGQIAVAVSSAINQQQNKGMNLNSTLGSDLFSVGGVQVLDNAKNTGSGTIAVTRSDVSQLTTSNYTLTKTAGGWSLSRADTGQAVTMTGAGTALNPFVADGLSFVVGGAAATGDRFQIQPTSNAVAGMQVNFTDPNGIAAAAPIIGAANNANTGNASITQGVVTDASNANLLTPVTIQFLSPTTYTTDGGTTTNAYTSGQSISLNGWQVNISGAPVTGDRFTVQSNSNGSGDNRNALLMSNAMDAGFLNGGTTSINHALGIWVADIGVKSSQAQSNLTTQSAVYDDVFATQQNNSGVNLDEEAANILRFQQAYAAAAKIISTSNTLFDSLIQAIG